jgi:tight adherence protein C
LADRLPDALTGAPMFDLALAAVPGVVLVVAAAVVLAGLRSARSDPVDGVHVDDLVLLRPEPRVRAAGRGPLDAALDPLAALVRRLAGPPGMAWIQRTVDQAGRPEGMTADTVVRRIAWWLVLVTPLALALLLLGLWWLAPFLPLVGALLPLMTLSRARRLRQRRIDLDLPDFLDVLAVTVTGGVAFRAALAQVADRFGGPLGEEMHHALERISSGATVREAFRQLRERNESPSLSQFVTAYLQSEELGAPIAHTLNRIALDIRRAGAQRMRREAGRVEPQVTLVTILVLVPAVLAVMVVGIGFAFQDDLRGLLSGDLLS